MIFPDKIFKNIKIIYIIKKMKYYCDENILGIRICYKEPIKNFNNNRIDPKLLLLRNPYKLSIIFEYCHEDYLQQLKNKMKEYKIKDLRKYVFYTLHKFYTIDDNLCFMEWKRNYNNIPLYKLKKFILN